MPAALQVLDHVATNTNRGLFPQKGAGFQTLQAAAALIGTPDLRCLEEMATYYEVDAARRASGDLPVRETFFQLPSGRVAVGRTRDAGVGPGGRAGNSLAHHVVIERAVFQAVGADPFAVLEAADPAPPGPAGDPAPLPPREIRPEPPAPGTGNPALAPAFWSALLAPLLHGEPITLLLVGPETRTRLILRRLLWALDPEVRAGITFATHFSRCCASTRGAFRIATVRSRSEGPSADPQLRVLEVEGAAPAAAGEGPYAAWLGQALGGGNLEAIGAFQQVLAALRRSGALPEGTAPTDPDTLAALCERAGPLAVTGLPRAAGPIAALLPRLPAPHPVAAALLLHHPPAELVGAAAGETVTDAMAAERLRSLQGASPPEAWRTWTQKWSADPHLARLRRPGWMWWKR